MSSWRVARLIAAKDLRVERRSKIVTNQVLPFAGITMVSFAFALDKQNVLDTVAPGLVWLATTFSLLILVQRSFSIETDDGALDDRHVDQCRRRRRCRRHHGLAPTLMGAVGLSLFNPRTQRFENDRFTVTPRRIGTSRVSWP